METYPINTNDGTKIGFEIDLVYIGSKRIAQLLSKLDGVTNVRRRRMFDSNKEFHVEFDLYGEAFVVWEPYGDSSRYWICPKDKNLLGQIDISNLEAAFINYEPPILIKIFGSLLSLKFIKHRKQG